MEYAYAAILLNESGEELNEQNLTAVLDAAEANVSESRIKALVAAFEEVDVDDVSAVDIQAIAGTDADQEDAANPDEADTDRSSTAATTDADASADADPSASGGDPPEEDTPNTG